MGMKRKRTRGSKAMRDEREIRGLSKELEKITGFIGESGTKVELEDVDVVFACNVSDALWWVLEEISTKGFRSERYLNMTNLKRIVGEIERRTGRGLEGYE